MRGCQWRVLAWTTVAGILLILGCGSSGRPVRGDGFGHIEQEPRTKEDVVKVLGKPDVEMSLHGGSTLIYYHNSQAEKTTNAQYWILFGMMGPFVAEASGNKPSRVNSIHTDTIWVLIAADNRVSNAVRIRRNIYFDKQGGREVLVNVRATEDGPSLFDGSRDDLVPIHFISDPPGARIEVNDSTGVFPQVKKGLLGYAPFVVKGWRAPFVSGLKRCRVHAVWEDTGRKSKIVSMGELYTNPKDFVFQPETN